MLIARMVGQQVVQVAAVANPRRRQLIKMMVGTGAAGALIGMGKIPALASIAGIRQSPNVVSQTDKNGDTWRIETASNDVIEKLAFRWQASTSASIYPNIESHGSGPLGDVSFISVFRNDQLVRNVASQTFGVTGLDWGVYLSFEANGNVLEHAVDFRNQESPQLYGIADDGILFEVDPEEAAADAAAQPAGWWPDSCGLCSRTCNFIVYN